MIEVTTSSTTSTTSSGGAYDEYDDRDDSWYQRTGLSQTYDDEVHRHIDEEHPQPVVSQAKLPLHILHAWQPKFDPNANSQEESSRKCYLNSTIHKPRGQTKCSDGTDRHGTCACGGMVNLEKKAACGCANAKCKICTRSYRAHREHLKRVKKEHPQRKDKGASMK